MENCNVTPNQDIKATYDPGWNDPPKFSYNAQQTTPNRPRNFLNKRVAFPLSNTSSTPLALVNLPPIPVNTQLLPPTKASLKSFDGDIEIDSESALKEVKDILITLSESSSELGPKVNDIKRRIAVMEDMWTNGKLNKNIHSQMKELATALKDNNPQKADEIHTALMVDHVSAVSTWMPGIKLLIRNSIARSELLALDDE